MVKEMYNIEVKNRFDALNKVSENRWINFGDALVETEECTIFKEGPEKIEVDD